ncbi:hypothetical protein ZWY2020_034045, partial [Hordeum vulgare]
LCRGCRLGFARDPLSIFHVLSALWLLLLLAGQPGSGFNCIPPCCVPNDDIMCGHVAGILHTIFFHRTLTLVWPKDVDRDLFEITYGVGEKINQFIAWAEKLPNRKSQKNKHPGWFSGKTERIYCEQRFINFHVTSLKGQSKSRGSKALASTKGQALEDTNSRRDALSLLIQEVMFHIINYANEKKTIRKKIGVGSYFD